MTWAIWPESDMKNGSSWGLWEESEQPFTQGAPAIFQSAYLQYLHLILHNSHMRIVSLSTSFQWGNRTQSSAFCPMLLGQWEVKVGGQTLGPAFPSCDTFLFTSFIFPTILWGIFPSFRGLTTWPNHPESKYLIQVPLSSDMDDIKKNDYQMKPTSTTYSLVKRIILL